jgi:hypothetical protein
MTRTLAAVAVVLAVVMLAPSAEARAKRTAPAGPIVGGIAANNGYYAYGPYYAPGPYLGWSPLLGPALPVPAGCYLQRQRIWTEYGWRWRTAPICY